MEDANTQTKTNIKRELEVRCIQCNQQITVRIFAKTKVKQCDVVFVCPFCSSGNFINWKNIENIAITN